MTQRSSRRSHHPSVRTALLLSPCLLAACSGGGAAGAVLGAETQMTIQGCSLGCSPIGVSQQIHCESGSLFVNQDIEVLFTQAVDLATVGEGSFQIVELATGKAPTGAFSLDPTTPSRVRFRPQLTFDSTGTPIFGLVQGQQYLLKVPGSSSDPPPYVRSTSGNENETRLECILVADKGAVDLVEGPPSVQVLVDVVTEVGAAGAPVAFALGVPAQGAVDVFRDSGITFVFDDIMNPSTLVNPVTQASATLAITVDLDGDTADASDQVALPGHFALDIDQDLQRTTVVFTPQGGLPSAGTGPEKRAVVVRVPAVVADLGGNTVANPGEHVFTPEVIAFASTLLPGGTGEEFETTVLRDERRTGALWGGGALLPASTGGAGHLGDLVVEVGQTVVLCTDGECGGAPGTVHTFQGPDVLPLGAEVAVPGEDPSVDVTDGVFPFASITVRAGGVLAFSGGAAPRLFGRGDVVVQGRIDLAGREPAGNAAGGHPSSDAGGGPGGAGGPGAGDGGRGGDRPDDTGSDLLDLGGVANPGAVVDGQSGEGVGGAGSAGHGPGGSHWPLALPSAVDQASWGDLDPSNTLTCHSDQLGASGGGGAHATGGGVGHADPPLLTGEAGPASPTPDTLGGDAGEVGLGPLERTLDPELGLLRGGAGGGGGGASVHLTRANGTPTNCGHTGGNPPQIDTYMSHSGAGGGGGGGAVQLVGGGRVILDGIVDATGGAGGDSRPPFLLGQFPVDRSAAAGGGGAGGGVLIRSEEVQIGATPGRVLVNGGNGGNGVGNSSGGAGGDGIVRLEGVSLDAALEAPKLSPFDPLDPASAAILSVGELQPTEAGPGALSGAQSCWMGPTGSFFDVTFEADAGSDLGWDMQLLTSLPGAGPQSYRGANSLLPGSLEDLLGSDLLGQNPAPIVVRFQGVRTIGASGDPCSLVLSGPQAQVVEGSLTGWVRHPAELNTWWDHLGPVEATQRRPNLLRYQVLFDRSTPFLDELILGVDSIFIRVQPD